MEDIDVSMSHETMKRENFTFCLTETRHAGCVLITRSIWNFTNAEISCRRMLCGFYIDVMPVWFVGDLLPQIVVSKTSRIVEVTIVAKSNLGVKTIMGLIHS